MAASQSQERTLHWECGAHALQVCPWPSLLFEHLKAHLVTACQLLQYQKMGEWWLAFLLPSPQPPWCLWSGWVAGIKRTRGPSGQSAAHKSNQLACPARSSRLMLALELSLNKYKNEKCKEITLSGGISPISWLKQDCLIYKRQWSHEEEKELVGTNVWKARAWEDAGWWAVPPPAGLSGLWWLKRWLVVAQAMTGCVLQKGSPRPACSDKMLLFIQTEGAPWPHDSLREERKTWVWGPPWNQCSRWWIHCLSHRDSWGLHYN